MEWLTLACIVVVIGMQVRKVGCRNCGQGSRRRRGPICMRGAGCGARGAALAQHSRRPFTTPGRYYSVLTIAYTSNTSYMDTGNSSWNVYFDRLADRAYQELAVRTENYFCLGRITYIMYNYATLRPIEWRMLQ